MVYRISSVHGSPLRGLSLNLSFLNFLNNFFHGILSRPFERVFFSEKNTILFFMSNMGLKNKKCHKIYKMATFDSL